MYKKCGQNAKLARLHNRAMALRLITQAGGLSRKELADRMGLTKAAMTKISEELIALGLVAEGFRDAAAGLGRRPIPLAVDPAKFRIMTLHIGRRRLKSYLSDATAAVLKKSECSSRMLLGSATGMSAALLERVRELIDGWGIRDRRFFAIAIASPGLIRTGDFARTPARDRRYRQPYLWESLHEHLAPRLGCPVFVENDANMMALGEQWFGRGRDCSHFVLYNIGEGIGAAPVIDDMLYRGHNTLVAEVGHVTVDKDGEPCSCGNRGCLELYAGFSRLREKFLAASGDWRPRSYEADLAELFRRRGRGDPVCADLVREHARLVSLGAIGLANMFSPEKIVVGVNDCDAVDLEPFVERMRDDVANRAFTAIRDGIGVEASALGANAMCFGGTALVMSELLADTGWLSGKWQWKAPENRRRTSLPPGGGMA